MAGPDKEKLNLERDPLFIIIIGTNGTGKTTVMLECLDMVQGGGLIIDPNGMEEDWTSRFPEIEDSQIALIKDERCLITKPSDEAYSIIQTSFNGRFLVIDDCRYYINTRGESNFHKIIQRRRQIGMDIFAACHGLSEVPKFFWAFATHAFVFKTGDSYRRLKSDMNPEIFARLESAILEVNRSNNPHEKILVNLR